MSISEATGYIKSWLSGEKLDSRWMHQQTKIIVLVVVFIFLYILAGYRALLQQQHLAQVRQELKDAKFEYLTVSAERTALTRQSHVESELKARGSSLKPNRKPPMRIEK